MGAGLKVFALQLHRIDADVKQDLHAVFRHQADSVFC